MNNFYTTELVDNELRAELTELADAGQLTGEILDKVQIRAAELFKFIKSFNESISEFILGFEDDSMNESYGRVIDMVMASAPRGVFLTGVEQEFEVEVTVTGTITTNTIVHVSAVSQDAAIQLVSEDPDVYVDAEEVLGDAVSGGEGWDIYDVEVA